MVRLQVPEVLKFLRQLSNPLMLLLIAAGALMLVAYAASPPVRVV